MALITLRPSSAWSETLLHRFDVVLDRVEDMTRKFFADPRLKAAISDFLDRERAYIAQEKAALDEMSPYRHADSA